MIMRLIDADAVIKEQRSIMESLYGGTVKVLKKHMDIDDDLSVPMHGMEGYAKAKQYHINQKHDKHKEQHAHKHKQQPMDQLALAVLHVGGLKRGLPGVRFV